jgi:hypothetical protein
MRNHFDDFILCYAILKRTLQVEAEMLGECVAVTGR